MKTCSKCGKECDKHCKDCHYLLTKSWKARNKEREKQNRRRSALKQAYGISLEQYDEMLKNQDNGCAICKRLDTGSTRASYFHVDHCHKTGKIRGLLCNNCNRGIGYLGDDSQRLLKAVEYLNGA